MTIAKPPIGLFGGTFDPIHSAHLRLAQVLGEEFGLAEVRFIPAGLPPHRQTPRVSPQQRLEMVERAIAGNPLFKLDAREVTSTGPSFTVTTLEAIRMEVGDQPLCLLLGGDAFLNLPSWYQWRKLFELAHIVVAHRPGTDVAQDMPGELREACQGRFTEGSAGLKGASCGSIVMHALPPLAISASMIRNLLGEGRSARYLLPGQVLDYIQCNNLYR